MIDIPHAKQSERHLAGAAVRSPAGARLVARLANPDAFYAGAPRRVIEAALALDDPPDVDLSSFDDELGVLGPHIVVRGMALDGPLLARIVATAEGSDTSVMSVATMVADLACRPCERCVGGFVADIAQAGQRRAALTVLHDLLRRVIEDPAVAASVLALEPHDTRQPHNRADGGPGLSRPRHRTDVEVLPQRRARRCRRPGAS